MPRFTFALPYTVLGLVLVLAFGGFAVSASVDPRAFAYDCTVNGVVRSGWNCNTARYATSLGLPPMDEVKRDELRIWAPYHTGTLWGHPVEMFAYIVTPTSIRMIDSGAEIGDLIGRDVTETTSLAAQIIALTQELMTLDGEAAICFEHDRYWGSDFGGVVEGVYGGQRFSFEFYRGSPCDAPSSLALMRAVQLMDSVSGRPPGWRPPPTGLFQ